MVRSGFSPAPRSWLDRRRSREPHDSDAALITTFAGTARPGLISVVWVSHEAPRVQRFNPLTTGTRRYSALALMVVARFLVASPPATAVGLKLPLQLPTDELAVMSRNPVKAMLRTRTGRVLSVNTVLRDSGLSPTV